MSNLLEELIKKYSEQTVPFPIQQQQRAAEQSIIIEQLAKMKAAAAKSAIEADFDNAQRAIMTKLLEQFAAADGLSKPQSGMPAPRAKDDDLLREFDEAPGT